MIFPFQITWVWPLIIILIDKLCSSTNYDFISFDSFIFLVNLTSKNIKNISQETVDLEDSMLYINL